MMTDALLKALHTHFSYDHFRPGQREAIEASLAGENTLVMLPTGSGKTLCYTLTGKIKKQLTIIVSPLLSLMQDQVSGLKQQGIKDVVAISSMQSYQEKQYTINHLDNYAFIFLSPEMITNPEILKQLRQQNIGLFVVDEAHCISQWGMDFRPEYLQLGEVRKNLHNPLTMALTATATEDVRQDIDRYLFQAQEEHREIIYSVDRENIAFHVDHCQDDKMEKVINYVNYLEKPGIIYFSSKKQADEVAEKLNKETSNRVVSYHGGLNKLDRAKIQARFLAEEIDIVCATSAFGMGIDKENIRFVLHYHLPASPEAYLQEVGRAGRDGKDSLAILLYEKGDEEIQRYFIRSALPAKQTLEWVYNGNNCEADLDGIQLANYFYQADVPLEEALIQVKARYAYKKKQLQIMLDYISCGSCYRKFLLAYFGEIIQDTPTKCCSNDNETLVSWYLDEKHIIHRTLASENLNWREILARLFEK